MTEQPKKRGAPLGPRGPRRPFEIGEWVLYVTDVYHLTGRKIIGATKIGATTYYRIDDGQLALAKHLRRV